MKRKMSFDSPVLLFSTLFIASDSDSGEIMLTYASEKKPKGKLLKIAHGAWKLDIILGVCNIVGIHQRNGQSIFFSIFISRFWSICGLMTKIFFSHDVF